MVARLSLRLVQRQFINYIRQNDATNRSFLVYTASKLNFYSFRKETFMIIYNNYA